MTSSARCHSVEDVGTCGIAAWCHNACQSAGRWKVTYHDIECGRGSRSLGCLAAFSSTELRVAGAMGTAPSGVPRSLGYMVPSRSALPRNTDRVNVVSSNCLTLAATLTGESHDTREASGHHGCSEALGPAERNGSCGTPRLVGRPHDMVVLGPTSGCESWPVLVGPSMAIGTERAPWALLVPFVATRGP